MELKQIVRYKLDFSRKWVAWSGALMGLAFFLQAVYFFGVRAVQIVPAGMLIMCMIFPMLLEAGWFIMLRTIRLNAPGIFGILGAVYYLFLAVQGFIWGNALVAVLSLVCYILAAGSFFAVVGGFVRQQSIALGGCILALVLRLICWHFTKAPFLAEAAAWSGMCAFLSFIMSLKEVK